MTISAELVGLACTALFYAGGLWFVVNQARKDCNGLGRKLGEMDRRQNARYQRALLAFWALSTEENKGKLIELLREE